MFYCRSPGVGLRFAALSFGVVVGLAGFGAQMGAVSAAVAIPSGPASSVASTPAVAVDWTAAARRKASPVPKPGGSCRKGQFGRVVASARYGNLRCGKNRVWTKWRSSDPVSPGTTSPGAEPVSPAPPGGSAPSLPPDPPTDPPPASTPFTPIPFTKNTVFTVTSAQSNYWIFVPTAYDATHATPITLFVWLHGCGGYSQWDIHNVSPGGSQSYISTALGGREGGCWDVNSDPALVLAAIANVKSHFNINPHRVVIGGYSSGGDLAYRTAFYNANTFAGVLAENTAPFSDTGSSQSAALAAAAWKFHVVHLAHTGDTTYPIAGVRAETDSMLAAGFPITRIERSGNHWDNDSGSTGTNYDLKTLLLPHLDDGWLSP